MEKESRSINLLSDKGKNASDIFLFWALYIGRLLVIITEAIALFVFLSRFSIDRKLIDLKDEIETQQAQVSFFKEGEEKFRIKQLKLKVSETNTASSEATVKLFEEMFQKANDQLRFNALTVTPSSLTVTAQTSSPDILSAFTQDLREHPLVNTLSVDKIESKPKSALVSITLTAQLKTKNK